MRRFLLVIEDCIDKVDVGSCFEDSTSLSWTQSILGRASIIISSFSMICGFAFQDVKVSVWNDAGIQLVPWVWSFMFSFTTS